MSIKIKVNIPFDINRCIENDMKSFGFIKNDGKINKNKFINQLLKYYYLSFSNTEVKQLKKIKQYLNEKKIDVLEDNLSDIIGIIKESNYQEKYYYDYSIQFIINKENEGIFNTIEKFYLRNRSLSQYFREMLISYASNKQDERELLLFPETVKKIETAINNQKRILIIFNNNTSLIMDPYSIDKTKEELYNYLLGVQITKAGNREIISTKIHKIKDIIITEDSINIRGIEKELLNKTMQHGAQFPINENETIKLELTPKGEKLYENAYLNRPIFFKKEGNIYYFDCSLNQIDFYFFKFGEDVKIISPENLRNRFSKKYYLALSNYKKNRVSN